MQLGPRVPWPVHRERNLQPMHMRIRRTLSVLAAALVLVLLATPVSAHEQRTVGDYDLVVGLIGEPVFTGQKSGLEFSVSSGDTPIEGLEATLEAEVIYQGQSRSLTISPRFGQPGWYQSVFFPTAAGPYTFHIFGTIEDTAIDETFTSSPDGFSEVEDQAGGQFPVQIAAPADVARDAEAGAAASGMATLGVVLGGAGLLVGLIALGISFAGRRRAA